MQRIILGIILTVAPVSFLSAGQKYTIDPSHTYPNFTISHLGFSTVHGRFNSTKGQLTYDAKKKTGSVSIIIDAKSINTGFAKRDKHLKSPDFLNVTEFPEITFKSNKVSFVSDTNGTIDGTLTIMGTSKPTTLKVTNIKCGAHPFNKKDVCGFDAIGTIKRSDFGVKYGLPAIGDEMVLSIGLEAIKN